MVLSTYTLLLGGAMVPSGEDCCSQRGNSTMEVVESPSLQLQSCDGGFVCVCPGFVCDGGFVCVCVCPK